MTEESMAPFFAHRLEKEVKETITQLFFEENEIDRETIHQVTQLNEEMGMRVQQLGQEMQGIKPVSTFYAMTSQFFSEHAEMLLRKNKLREHSFHKYFQALAALLKRGISFWQFFKKTLSDLSQEIENMGYFFGRFSVNLSAAENTIYKLLEDIPDSLGSIFRV